MHSQNTFLSYISDINDYTCNNNYVQHKKFKNTTVKLAIGLFLSVIIYYINNFNVMGSTEKISIITSFGHLWCFLA